MKLWEIWINCNNITKVLPFFPGSYLHLPKKGIPSSLGNGGKNEGKTQERPMRSGFIGLMFDAKNTIQKEGMELSTAEYGKLLNAIFRNRCPSKVWHLIFETLSALQIIHFPVFQNASPCPPGFNRSFKRKYVLKALQLLFHCIGTAWFCLNVLRQICTT